MRDMPAAVPRNSTIVGRSMQSRLGYRGLWARSNPESKSLNCGYAFMTVLFSDDPPRYKIVCSYSPASDRKSPRHMAITGKKQADSDIEKQSSPNRPSMLDRGIYLVS